MFPGLRAEGTVFLGLLVLVAINCVYALVAGILVALEVSVCGREEMSELLLML